jgi:NADH:ubiquinone oxidoreductase subunit 5 (subunit L)/multisubunit Na+/H+ antiporter MnhA subunit
LIWFAGILSLAGLPLTPGFLGRAGLYVSLWETGQWLILVIAGLTTALVLAPLWNLAFDLQGTENRKATLMENAGLVLITLSGAALAFAPMLIAHALGPEVGNSAERAFDRSIRTNDVLGVAIGFATLILPVIGSYYLRIPARHFHPRAGSLLLRAAHVIDLEWLARASTKFGYRVGALARGASTIAEENPTVWILLAGLWVAIFISIVR